MKFIIEITGDCECRIIDVDCSGLKGEKITELTFPAEIIKDGKTYRVKEVGKRAWWTNNDDENLEKLASLRQLRKITFSEGIEEINSVKDPKWWRCEDGNCYTLQTVVLPSTLKKIGEQYFRGCKALSCINIPEGLEEIGEMAFSHCESLPLFQWPKSLKKVDISAFYNMLCPKDEDGDSKFILEIPDNIESIDGEVYSNILIRECKVSLNAWNVLDSSQLGHAIQRLTIPEGVTKIMGKYSSMKHVVFPSSLLEIGDEAFRHSSVLHYLDKLPDSIKSIGDRAFEFAYDNHWPEAVKEIRIPSPDVRIGISAFNQRHNHIQLTGDDATMKRLLFQPGALNGTLVEEINFPEGVSEINIINCPNLTKVIIPNTVKKIDVIDSCPKLASLNIPDSVTHIKVIEDCDSLKSLVIPDSVISIYGIKGLSELENLRLSNQLELLGSIEYCQKLKMISLPDSLKTIAEDQDGNEVNFISSIKADIEASPKIWNLICSKDRSIRKWFPIKEEFELPEGVEKFAKGIFDECGFKSIKLPASVKSIGSKAFFYCSSLTKIDFPENSLLEKIDQDAFIGGAIKEMRLPDKLRSIERGIFNDIKTLEFVIFPASLQNFADDKIFEYCRDLKYVVFLTDSPETAVYPSNLGKKVDWYVPDNMVQFAKEFVEQNGKCAKSVKPLSKLNKKDSGCNNNISKTIGALSVPIRMRTLDTYATYKFPVREEDLHMLENELDRAILAGNYMRDRISECSFDFENTILSHRRGDMWELKLDSEVNSSTKQGWSYSEDKTIKLDFSKPDCLPKNFPFDKLDEIAAAGGFAKLFAEKCPCYRRKFPKGTVYLEISFPIKVVFDFMIGEKEKFNVNKIRVTKEWWKEREESEDEDWQFYFIYNGRFIRATSVETIENTTEIRYTKIPADPKIKDLFPWRVTDSLEKTRKFRDPLNLNSPDTPSYKIDNVTLITYCYYSETLPFFDLIFSLMK